MEMVGSITNFSYWLFVTSVENLASELGKTQSAFHHPITIACYVRSGGKWSTTEAIATIKMIALDTGLLL